MAVSMIGPKFYAWDRDGKPLAFGKLYTYQARTNTPKDTYQSEDQIVENGNPVILNGEGYANVYLDGSYKVVLKDQDNNEIWSADPVTAQGGEEWVNCQAATYASPTSFKITGNITGHYDVGRMVRIDNNTTEYSYSSIVSSVFAGGETTVTVVDSVVLVGVAGVCSSIIGVESTKNQLISDLSQDYTFDDVKAYKDSLFLFPEGKRIYLKDRQAYFEVIAGTGTANDTKIIANTQVGQSASLTVTDKTNVQAYGAQPDNIGHDDKPAFISMMGDGVIRMGKGNDYYISTPIEWSGTGMIGQEIVNRDENLEVGIYAPNGLFINSTQDRVFGTWSYFRVYGDGLTATGTIGFNGRFGGFLTGVYIEQFETLLFNDFAYLLYFSKCRFNHADIGLQLATANGTVFDNCWFGSTMRGAIDAYDTPLGPSATQTSFPLVINGGTNFNANTSTEFLVKARGGIVLEDSYIEVFGITAGASLVQIIAGRFDTGFLKITGNLINGQNKVDRLIHMYGNNALGTNNYNGDISKNTLLGSLQKPILIGSDPTLTASDLITGVDCQKNSTSFGRDYVDYNNEAGNLPVQFFRGSYSGALDVTGGSYVDIPLVDDVDSYGTQVDGSGRWVCTRDGLYTITIAAEHRSNVNLRTAETRLEVNSAQVNSWVGSLAIPDSEIDNWYEVLSYTATIPLERGDIIGISARNGKDITMAEVSAVRIGDYNW